METNEPSRPKSAFRIVVVVLSGLVLGHLIAVIVCYVQPKLYESRAVVVDKATPPGQSTTLSSTHAALVATNLHLDRRWGVSMGEAVDKLRQSVRIELTQEGAVISGRFSSAQDSRLITQRVARTFPGFEREAEWQRLIVHHHPYSPTELRKLEDLWRLERYLIEDLIGKGLPRGSAIPPETIAIIDSEDLQRRFQAYRELNHPPGRFSPPDGVLTIPPTILQQPWESYAPVSPDIETHILVGRLGGLLAGGLALMLIARFRPTLIEAPPAEAAREPDWAGSAPPPPKSRTVDY